MAPAAEITPDLLHRVASVATGGLEASPHNGALIILLAIFKLTHRQSCLDAFIVAWLFPLVPLETVIGLVTQSCSFQADRPLN